MATLEPFRIYLTALYANTKGGADVYTLRLAQELSRRGLSVTIVCYDADIHLESCCQVVKIRKSCSKLGILWRLHAPWKFISAVGAIRKRIDDEPSVIIGGPDPITFAVVRKWRHIPLIYVPHSLVAPLEVAGYSGESGVQRYIAKSTYHFVEKYLLRRAFTTVRFTAFGCEVLKKYYGSDACQSFSIVPMAIQIPRESELTQNKKNRKLLFVGRLVASKNVAFLLKLLCRLTRFEWTIDIVGDGPELRNLQAIARECGISDRVAFFGHQERTTEFFRGADIFLFPSKLESLGLVVLEAMSFGVPVIAFRNDAVDYVNPFHEFINSKNGYLVRDEEGFYCQLEKILQNGSELGQVGRAARHSVEGWTWENHIERYREIFNGTSINRSSRAS